MIVRDVFDLTTLWAEIEALDNKVTAAVQIEMLLEIVGCDRACGRLAAARAKSLAIGRESWRNSRQPLRA